MYIIPFVCAVQTAEHNSAHLKWKIKSCQTIASNLLLHTMQWQFIVTKKTPVSDKSLHSFQNPYTHCITVSKMKVRFHRCVLLCTVEIWVHNMVRSCYSKIKSYKTSSILLCHKPLLLPRHLGRTLYFIFILGFLGPMGPSTLAPARKLLYSWNKRF